MKSVGLVDRTAVGVWAGTTDAVFTDKTTDLRPSNAAAEAVMYNDISRILPCGGHSLAGGQSFHLA